MQMLISAVKKGTKEGADLVIFLVSSPIIWSSKMQHCVIRSTTEAEYVSFRNAVTDVMWMKRLLESLGYKQGCVPIYEDNKACISWANDETVSKLARHIHVSYQYTKEMVQAIKRLKSNMWTQSIKWQMCSQRH